MSVSESATATERARWVTYAVCVLGVAAVVVIYLSGRGLIFYFDEWDFIQTRRTGFGDAFLRPHNGHLSAVPVAVYRTLFAAVGLRHYGAYRLVLATLHASCGLLLYSYGRRRADPLFAAVAAASLLTLAAGWQDLLWPFQIGFLSSIAFGLLALNLRDRRHSLLAAFAVLASLASSGLGVPILAGFLVESVVRRAGHELAALSVPSAVYGAWYFARGEPQAAAANLGHLPGHVATSGAAAVHAMTGIPMGGAAVLGCAVLVGAGIFSFVTLPNSRPRLLFAATSAGSFWCLTALTRGQFAEPGASRYAYPSAAFVLIGLVEASRLLRGRRAVLGALAAMVAVISALVVNISAFEDGVHFLRETSGYLAAELGALETVQSSDAAFKPDRGRAPQISAGAYFAASRSLGSPALTPAQIAAAPSGIRAAADQVMAAAGGARLVDIDSTPDATACHQPALHAAERFSQGTTLRNDGTAPARIAAAAFAESTTPTFVGDLPPGATAALRLPSTPGTVHWRIFLPAGVLACPAGP